MQAGNVPIKFTYAWGAQAGSAYITTPIPAGAQVGSNAGRASQQIGFPPPTFSDPATGGIWPDGRDIQGALNMLSNWSIWQQGGGPIAYDATFQANQGGYAKGAVVGSGATPGLLYLSTQDSNFTNPDAGGAGWLQITATFGGIRSGWWIKIPIPSLGIILIIQGGYVQLPTGNADVIGLPIPFTTTFLGGVASDGGANGTSSCFSCTIQPNGGSLNTFLAFERAWNPLGYVAGDFSYIAIGW